MSGVKSFSLLIKPASANCNLRCQYCFYLDRLNLYSETKQHRMTEDTLEWLIRSYMGTGQRHYSFGWQGGEPTLMGVGFYRKAIALQGKYLPKGAKVANALQTNATLLDEEFAAFLHKYNFLVGVSLDGPAQIHDYYRRRSDGQGTHSAVLQGIELLRRQRVEFNILTLVNDKNVKRGKEVFNYFCDLGFDYQQYIPCVEFDVEGNPLPYTITGTEWGDFLCAVFDEWMGKDPLRVSIRLFDSILALLIDGFYNLCHMGGNCNQYYVVEYNGDLYPCDFFVHPDLLLGNITDTTWESLHISERYSKFGEFKTGWNHACASCKYLVYCSGDCLKHRFRKETARRPEDLSWLCAGWQKFLAYSLPEFKKLARFIVAQRQKTPYAKVSNGHLQLPEMLRTARNELCFCGSGKKRKKCHNTNVY